MDKKDEVQDIIRKGDYDVLMVLGAGDLNDQVPAITEILRQKYGV